MQFVTRIAKATTSTMDLHSLRLQKRDAYSRATMRLEGNLVLPFASRTVRLIQLYQICLQRQRILAPSKILFDFETVPNCINKREHRKW